NVNNQPTNLNRRRTKLSNHLTDLHLTDSSHTHLPEYTYEKLKKGIVCKNCFAFYTLISNSNIKCTSCGTQEKILTAILRNIKEVHLLFPNLKINTSLIHQWRDAIAHTRVCINTL